MIETSGHLPECPLLEPCDDEVAEHGYCSMQHGVFCIHCNQWCICDRLRACEQRVEESMDRAWGQTVQIMVAHTRTSTLDAARDAVAGTGGRIWMGKADALAAIDALLSAPDVATAPDKEQT